MTFDNHDSRIRYVHLTMERDDLTGIAHYELPKGYRFAYYQPGDEDSWIPIEISAKELKDYAQGREVWQKYYGGLEETLLGRMLFIENEQGEKIATATAYHGPDGVGQVHWVAVRRQDQGKGLARPLISRTLERLAELGHESAMLTTQTTTWVACRLYLNFGFHPAQSCLQEEMEGWRILRKLTDHPALKDFEMAENVLA